MKRIIYMIVAALMLISCGDKGGNKDLTLSQKLYGEWHSTSLPIQGDIYISFLEKGSVEMFQKIGSGAYRQYNGTWKLEDDILTGKYNDGEAWAAAYTVVIEGTTLTLTSKNDAEETGKYSACTIPTEVKDMAVVVVKSSGERLPL